MKRKIGSLYYYIDSAGNIMSSYERNENEDDYRFMHNNYFISSDEVLKAFNERRVEKMNIDNLKKEIAHQVRNGRDSVYLKNTDLLELGYTGELSEDERTFIDESVVESLISNYEKNKFKEGLKVTVKNHKTSLKALNNIISRDDDYTR